jgi:hypothetical protein
MGAAQAVSHLAVKVYVNKLARDGATFHLLALDSQRGATADQLALPFAKQVGAAKVARDFGNDVAKSASPSGVTPILNEGALAVGYGATGVGWFSGG